MDNHPIPQDVTHFQFKLIGNLTLKQFGYVAVGGISAWIAISTGLPFLVKLIIAIILAGGGLGIAFMPVEGRPADLMLRYFFQALFQPNQYLYQKQGGDNALIDTTVMMTNNVPPPSVQQTPQASQQQTVLPSGMPVMQSMTMPSATQKPPFPSPLQTPQPTVAQQAVSKQTTPVVSPLDLGATISTQIQQPSIPAVKPMSPLPEMKPTLQSQSGISQIHQLSNPMPMSPQPPMPAVNPMPTTSTPPSPNLIKPPVQKEETPQIQDQLQQTLAQKKQLEEQLEQLKKQLEQTKQAAGSVSDQQSEPHEASETRPTTQPVPSMTQVPVSPVIKTVPIAPKTSQAPMVSDFPNIIMGVVKDPRGNVLPNILIEVKDTDDNPVRAFKTNALGQFASATPLLNGTYTILFEDPAKKHSFDAVEIEVTGEIMQPIEIISHDEREDLRKELFG